MSCSQFTEAELRELETKVIVLLAHLVEGRQGVKMAELAKECDRFLDEHCSFLRGIKELMRNSEFLILSMAQEVSYLKAKKIADSPFLPQFSEEMLNEFKCWEVRPEFLETIFKPQDVKRVRSCRDATAQKLIIYQCLI